MIIAIGGFEQAANSVDRSLKKPTGTLYHWKLLTAEDFSKHKVVIAMKNEQIAR